MTTVRLWSLRQDALVEMDQTSDSLVVVTTWGEFDLSGADPMVYESLRRMRLGPVSLHNVTSGTPSEGVVGDSGTDVSPAALEKVLEQLSGSVVHSLGLSDGQAPLLSVIPVVDTPAFTPVTVAASSPVRLSRFVSMRPSEGKLLLESPTAQFAVALEQPLAVQIVAALTTRTSVGEIGTQSQASASVVADVVTYLVAAGVVLVGNEDLVFAEDTDPALRTWSHHELSFHRKSRRRQGVAPVELGAEHEVVPPPLVRPRPAGRSVPLHRPTLPSATSAGDSLTGLLETDHVCPEFSTTGLTSEALGELLFRAARVRSIGPAHLPLGGTHEVSQRPYFNIACFYELELYLCVNRCAGLDRGVYHYEPREHALTLINEDDIDLENMLDMAKAAAASTLQPSVLLSVTARMELTAWWLDGAAYSTALMHFGALQQTLYLTAKSMGLSAHAVPVDDNDIVERALGLNWPAEIGIGECVLDRLN
nr:SagB/ThcOx family dehydrogenase [Amycolatopsis marina]